MDSLTHIALGACMGEAFAGKTVGRKAMLWGALAQSLPDVDFIASAWNNTVENLLAHRGFTHSFLFCGIMGVVLAVLAERWHRPHNISLRRWIAFFVSVIFIHVFIDAFNNYGVGWFEPFSHRRISFNAIYVADPFFSIGPGIACLALILLARRSPKRARWWKIGLLSSGFYLAYCLANKTKIDSDVRGILNSQHISYTRYFTTPAPLQNWLWFVVAGDNKGYYIGYRSIFDSERKIDFHYFTRKDSLLASFTDRGDLNRLVRFSKQFYTVRQGSNDTLIFNDLRFGQSKGWEDPYSEFAFHYNLKDPALNKLVVQRGRFAGWNWQTIKSLLSRIGGN